MVSFGKFRALIALLGALIIGMAEPHMIMQTPAPYGDPDNSPLSSSGSNYPCKVTSDPATFYSTDGIIDKNTMVAGEAQTLSFKGSAVHGGGSCQLAITNDMQPSASTSWRVILSIESGCPSTDGTNPSTYNYTIPAETEPGQYSFAWTWISKLAGQPEYYMNCAPITVTASSSSKAKRHDVSLEPRADSYPELFVANLESINSCKTTSGTDVVFPDPGENVEKLLSGATPSYATISSSGCVPLSQTQGSGSLPTATAGGSGGSSAVTTAAVSATDSASVSSSSQTSQPSSAVFAPTATGGTVSSTTLVTTTTAQASSIYVIPVTTHDKTSSTLSAAASNQPSVATGGSSNSSAGGSAASSTKTQPLTTQSVTTHSLTTHTRSIQTRTTGSVPTATLSPTGGSSSSNSTGSTGSTSVKSGTCTDEGMFNCVNSDYQQCASGSWTSMQALPAGTTCQQGESEGLWAREIGLKALRKARRGVKFVYVRD
ncbi:hypothetical protein VPNG_07122 [Cytospora leucostoma]|uniref:Lytic polysaccharide monooxygenase n=1 Tax=Cytospora leucostoma TaxID=1230097 RepID=A0A423WV86_9PEZI|nr:hypothetical protein VPNG_07122 [Cytospora leucostoma]